MSKVTPEMLKSKLVFDSTGTRVGKINQVVRERYKKIAIDFIEIELEKKIPLGPRDKVKVRSKDAQLQTDGSIKVNFTRDELKVMSKEQELQRHPPTI
ncbi:MAG: hypothetical protein JXA54_10480 [Candidatus Heimdallarchaeota archaeon]|nr:hypothetical protein [Candidatus Heimdallarchaeota archaeon]